MISSLIRAGRSPHGERGLKSAYRRTSARAFSWSLPTRGAWIEITPSPTSTPTRWSLPTRGAWIEIIFVEATFESLSCRSPHGERGLKSLPAAPAQARLPSLPTRGAWIEIRASAIAMKFLASLPTRGAWIEISSRRWRRHCHQSLPTRGAWIEITHGLYTECTGTVAPHTGSVD